MIKQGKEKKEKETRRTICPRLNQYKDQYAKWKGECQIIACGCPGPQVDKNLFLSIKEDARKSRSLYICLLVLEFTFDKTVFNLPHVKIRKGKKDA